VRACRSWMVYLQLPARCLLTMPPAAPQEMRPLAVAAEPLDSRAFVLTKWRVRSVGPWRGQQPSGRWAAAARARSARTCWPAALHAGNQVRQSAATAALAAPWLLAEAALLPPPAPAAALCRASEGVQVDELRFGEDGRVHEAWVRPWCWGWGWRRCTDCMRAGSSACDRVPRHPQHITGSPLSAGSPRRPPAPPAYLAGAPPADR
jgi:hypothetical protein